MSINVLKDKIRILNSIFSYIMSASVVGFYSLPFFGRIRPVYLETSMVHIILNSSVLLILSSALPILSRTLGE